MWAAGSTLLRTSSIGLLLRTWVCLNSPTVSVWVCVSVCILVCVCMYVYVCVFVSVPMCVYMFVYVCVRVRRGLFCLMVSGISVLCLLATLFLGGCEAPHVHGTGCMWENGFWQPGCRETGVGLVQVPFSGTSSDSLPPPPKVSLEYSRRIAWPTGLQTLNTRACSGCSVFQL